MFVVLSRSRKLRDSFFSSPFASLACGKDEPAVKWPSSFLCAQAQVRGSYIVWEKDDIWSINSILQSCWPQQQFCFLHTALRYQPARRFWNQPDKENKHEKSFTSSVAFKLRNKLVQKLQIYLKSAVRWFYHQRGIQARPGTARISDRCLQFLTR